MIDLRPILMVVGILLTTLAVAMFLPALADATAGNPGWIVFLASAFLTLFIGVSLVLTNRVGPVNLSVRQTFLLTTLSWTVLTAFAALPFAFAKLDLTYTDAFFEAMSGLTTTGATVIVGLDEAAPGILLWRALLQWLGGIGIIVMAIAVLPMLRIAGMQLFRTESSEISEKVLPRTTQLSAVIGLIYVSLTAVAAAAYWTAGMRPFEATVHAMTTIATAGFSTSGGSIGHFSSATIEWLAVLFMLVASLPFLLYFQAFSGHSRALWRDSQVRWFLSVVVAAVAVMTLWRWLPGGADFGSALRQAAFNVVAVATTTGYSSTDYSLWGAFALTLFLLLMFMGGCTGSTAGGIKAFRFQVLYATARVQISRLMQPHGVFVPHFNDRAISDTVAQSVMSFFFLFAACFVVLALALAALGLDFLTSVSGAAAAITNLGPGLGDVIGPAGSYAPLPDAAKWLLSAGMLLGRLELFTVLVLFTPRFWRG